MRLIIILYPLEKLYCTSKYLFMAHANLLKDA